MSFQGGQPDESEEAVSEEAHYLCTFAATGERPAFQAIYICRECEELSQQGLCICQACADVCHADHDVEYVAMGPAYCDCQQIPGCCALAEESHAEAVRLGVPFDGMPEHVAIQKDGEYLQEAFTIPSLDDRVCDRLVKQASELIKHNRDTHWVDMNSNNNEKTCELEELALAILRRHVKEYNLCADDVTDFAGGAEWWVQVKPVSLPTCSTEGSLLEIIADSSEAVDLHYDKDEALAEAFDLGSFPTLSTVTYLTCSPNASPTLVFPHTYDKGEGEVIDEMLVSHPKRGKHLVFDGRLLHGAPAHFALRRQLDSSPTDNVDTHRVTFLVNVWATGRPSGVERLSSDIRRLIKGKTKTLTKRKNAFQDLEFESRSIARVDLMNEEALPESIRGRIELPFVSKGATWVDSDVGSDLVVVTFPSPETEEDTAIIRFGPGLQAYMDNIVRKEDMPEEKEDAFTEDYV